MTIQSISNYLRKRLLLSALVAGSLAALTNPARAINSNFILTSGTNQNLTILNGGTNVSLSVAANGPGNTTNITSTVPNTVLGWVYFGGGTQPFNAGDILNFNIPSGSAVLNTVSGAASTINGTMISNGKVFVLNPLGITVAGTAVLNTAGFYASTIPENISYFIANGTLQSFTTTPPANTASAPIVASLGSTNSGDVYLAANGVTVTGGTATGNLFVVSTGANVSLASATALTVNGALNVKSEGGLITIASGANMLVGGSTTLDTVTFATTPGSVTQGSTSTVFQTNGLTINAGTTGSQVVNLGNVTLGGTTGIGTANITAPSLQIYSDNDTKSLTVTSAGAINVAPTTTATSSTNFGGGVYVNTPTATLTFNAVGSVNYASTGTQTNIGGLTIVSSTGSITLPPTALTSTGTVSLTSAGNITTPGSTSITAPTINATSTAGTITVASNLTATTASTLNAAGAISIAGTVTAPTFSATSTGSSITTTAPILSTTSATLNAPGAITIGGGITAPTISVTSTGSTISNSSALTAGISTTETAVGTITIGGVITTPNYIATTSTGNITEITGGSITGFPTTNNGAAFATLTSTLGSITLPGTNINGIGFLGLEGAPLGATVYTNVAAGTVFGGVTSPGLTLLNGTNVQGAALITNSSGGIAIGNIATDSLTFSGASLQLNATAGPIQTAAYTLNVAGPVSLNTLGGNSITLGNAALGTVNTTYTFGTVSANVGGGAGAININANGGVVLGAISTTGALTVNSLSGAITNPNGVVAAGSGVFSAGTLLTVPATVTVGSTSSPAAIGTVTVNNASALTLVDSANTTIANGLNPLPTASLTITGGSSLTSSANIATLSFAVNGAGNVSITDPASLTISNSTDTAGTGNISITSAGTLTLGAGLTFTTSGTTSFIATTNKANIVDTANSPITITGPTIFQSDAAINIVNNTANSIATNSGAGVSLIQTNSGIGSSSASAGNSTVSFTEAPSINLAQLTMLGTGAVTIKSINGNITETAASAVTYSSTVSGGTVWTPVTGVGATGLVSTGSAVSFTASSGQVILNVAADNVFGGTVSVTALTDSSIFQGQSLTLGNVLVQTGIFTADVSTINATSRVGNNSISQSGTATNIWTYGPATFIAGGTGKITIGNSGNNFSSLTADVFATGGATDAPTGVITSAANPGFVANTKTSGAGTGSITIVKNNTLNLLNVLTLGGFTGSSQTSGIIEAASGTTGSGIFLGGAISTFTASTAGASITLTNTANDFGASSGGVPVKFITGTGGNVTIIDNDTAGTFLADGTNVNGNFTISDINTTGAVVIKDAGTTNGVITVGGLLSLSTPVSTASSIQFTGSNNSIASLTLRTGSGSSIFTDNTSLALTGNTSVSGNFTLTAASISAAGTSPLSFFGTVNLTAQTGTITWTDTQSFFQKTVTVSGAVGTNLSALSLANNFNSVAPVNIGNGYVPPGP